MSAEQRRICAALRTEHRLAAHRAAVEAQEVLPRQESLVWREPSQVFGWTVKV